MLLSRGVRVKERFMVGVSIVAVLFTLFLIVDIQMDYGLSKNALVPSHGRIKYVQQVDTGDGYNGIVRKFLQKNANNSPSKENFSSTNNNNINNKITVNKDELKKTEAEHDNFQDLVDYINLDTVGLIMGFETRHIVQNDNEGDLVSTGNPTLAKLKKIKITNNFTLLEKFHLQISKNELYPEKHNYVEELVHFMQTAEILHVAQKNAGTQLKLIIDYPNNIKALFKPMRFSRQSQTLPNHFYFSDFERHNAEIAAFHLDRLLGFRRTMPNTGRFINMTRDIYEVGDGELIKTFFKSPANNYCFHGKCTYYCDTGHAFCGDGDKMEGSFAAFFPSDEMAKRKVWRHPWRRSYSKHRKAVWETDDTYCSLVKLTPPYDSGRRLYDIMDMAVFDFLIGNMDRHHYDTFRIFGNETFLLHADHGRAFGKPFFDELSCLAPVIQCCMIRKSTLKTLLKFHNGPQKLGDALRASLARDPLTPVLWEPHYTAIDRRVAIILGTIRDCIKKQGELNTDEPVSFNSDHLKNIQKTYTYN